MAGKEKLIYVSFGFGVYINGGKKVKGVRANKIEVCIT